MMRGRPLLRGGARLRTAFPNASSRKSIRRASGCADSTSARSASFTSVQFTASTTYCRASATTSMRRLGATGGADDEAMSMTRRPASASRRNTASAASPSFKSTRTPPLVSKVRVCLGKRVLKSLTCKAASTWLTRTRRTSPSPPSEANVRCVMFVRQTGHRVRTCVAVLCTRSEAAHVAHAVCAQFNVASRLGLSSRHMGHDADICMGGRSDERKCDPPREARKRVPEQ